MIEQIRAPDARSRDEVLQFAINLRAAERAIQTLIFLRGDLKAATDVAPGDPQAEFSSAEDLLEMTKETLEQVVPALTKVKAFLEAVAARVSCIPLPGLTEIPDLHKLTEEKDHE
jgi:5,10-methylenetetrahydrofolate reductase